MRFYSRIAVVMSLGIAITPAARADDKADIAALYKKLVAAFKAKDVKTIRSMGTADFTSKEGGHTMNAEQSMKQIEQEFAMTKSMKKMVMTPDTISVKGKNATVMSSFASESVIVDTPGMFGPKGKTHTMSGAGKMREMLVKTPQGWKFKSIETISAKMMMDGKPMPMPGGPPLKPKKK